MKNIHGFYLATPKHGAPINIEGTNMEEDNEKWVITNLNGDRIEFKKDEYKSVIMTTFLPFSPG